MPRGSIYSWPDNEIDRCLGEAPHRTSFRIDERPIIFIRSCATFASTVFHSTVLVRPLDDQIVRINATGNQGNLKAQREESRYRTDDIYIFIRNLGLFISLNEIRGVARIGAG